MRINKFLASCGVASRRKSEEYITSGKVEVNGEIVTNLAFNVNEKEDIVTLSGKEISIEEEKVYFLLNKPKGYICTRYDKAKRKTIYDLLGKIKFRIFSVGRLDFDTEGLLLLTNDGDLANKLAHPKREIVKTYIARVKGNLTKEKQITLEQGVVLDDGFKTSNAKINILEKKSDETKLEITIHEGKNRQIRRMFEAVECEVVFLKRTRFATLKLGSLNRGEFRSLTKQEIESLKNL